MPLPAVVNLAGPEPISIQHLATTIGDVVGIAPRFRVSERPRAFDLIAESSLVSSLMDRPFTSFEAGIRHSFGPAAHD
jgi:nucleoside-diphosphate-sugar epimerase